MRMSGLSVKSAVPNKETENKMKKISLFVTIVLLIGMMGISASESKLVYYVSGAASAGGNGSEEQPFKTIEEARDAIRRYKQEHELPPEGAEVIVDESIYELTSTLKFTEEDSGTRRSPITYKARTGKKVTFSGGARIDSAKFLNIDDENIRARLKYPENVLCADISYLGETDILPYGNMEWDNIKENNPQEIFSAEKPLTVARWPNEGYATVGEITDAGEYYADKADKDKCRGFTIKTEADVSRWTAENDPRLYGQWYWDWAEQHSRIAATDTENGTITSDYAHGYGIQSGQRYYAYNILAELDQAGEYYIDRENKKLYMWATDINDVVLSVCKDSLISVSNAEYINFEGFDFMYSRAVQAFEGRGMKNCNVRNCTFSCMSGKGAYIGGWQNTISGCEIFDTSGGIAVSGGSRENLMPGLNKAYNNKIYRYDRIKKMSNPAIILLGVGNTAAHNEIFDAAHLAIIFLYNDHIIEYNNIHDVLKETTDAGAIYSYISTNAYAWRGTQIRYNYIHDTGIYAEGSVNLYKPGCHRYGVYLDGICGTEIYGNIFKNTEQGAVINSGRNNSVYENTFINVAQPVMATDLSADRKGTAQLDIELNEYYEKYPNLMDLKDDEEYGTPKYNLVRDNITTGKDILTLFRRKVEESKLYAENDFSNPMLTQVSEEDFDGIALNGQSTVYSLKPDFKYPDTSVMGITSGEAEKPDFGDVIKAVASSEKSFKNKAEYAADGNYATAWVSDGDGYIELDLGKRYNVRGLHYEPAPNERNSAFYKYVAEISNDRLHYKQAATGKNEGAADIDFSESFSARYIRLRSIGMAENQTVISAAEIYPLLSEETQSRITDIKIEGTAAVGETLEGFYRYFGATAESSRYEWYIGGRKVQSGKCTDMRRPIFKAEEGDGGKILTLKILNGGKVYISEGLRIAETPTDTAAADEAAANGIYEGFEVSNAGILSEVNYLTGRMEALLTANIDGMQKVYRVVADPVEKAPVISYLDEEDNAGLLGTAEKTDEEAQSGIYSYIWNTGTESTVHGPYYKLPKNYDKNKFDETTPYIVRMYLKEPSASQHTDIGGHLLYIGGGGPYKSETENLSTDKWTQWLAVSELKQKNIQPMLYGRHPKKIYIDNIRAEKLAVARIEPHGETEIAVPENGGKTATYTAEAYNQFGTKLGMDGIGRHSAQKVEWSIAESEPAGVEISKDGVLSVASSAQSGTVILRATAAKSDFAGAERTYGDMRVKITGKTPEAKAENVSIETNGDTAAVKYDFTEDLRDRSEISWYVLEADGKFSVIEGAHKTEINTVPYEGMNIRCKVTTENGSEVYSETVRIRHNFKVRASAERTPAANAFDGDENTVWKANASGTTGHWIELDFGRKTLIGGMNYMPVQTGRGNGDYEGAFYDYVLEVSNDGIHYTVLADRDEGCFEGKPQTALETDTVYVRYLRIRCPEWADISFYSTGAAELSPIIKEKTEAAPTAIGLEICGTAMSGETVNGKYLYNSLAAEDEGATVYTWYTAGTKDGRKHRVGGGYAANGVEYTVNENDEDKYLILGITAADKSGDVGEEVYSTPVKILSAEEKAAIMPLVESFDAQVRALDAEHIMLTDTEPEQRIEMPSVMGAQIRYTTDNAAYLTANGKILKCANWKSETVADKNAVPNYSDGATLSEYTAHITYGDIKFTRSFKAAVYRAAGKSSKSNAESGEMPAARYTNGIEITSEQSRSGEFSYLNTLKYGSPAADATYTFNLKVSDDKIAAPGETVTADSVWIARAFVKAEDGESAADIPIAAYHINDTTSRGYVLTNNAVSDGEWSEWQMISNKGTLWGGYAREFGFLIYSKKVTKLYVDDIELELLRIGSVEINGAKTVTPGSENLYSASVLNQFGTTLGMTETEITPKQTVKFGIKEYREGISINEETGLLSIAENVKPCKVVITAEINTPGGFKGKNGIVNDITGAYSAEKEITVLPREIRITGNTAENGTLNAAENVIWQISDKPAGKFKALGEGQSISTKNAGGKYIKAVSGTGESLPLYIAESVEVSDLMLYLNDIRSDMLKMEKGNLKVNLSVKNNGEKTDISIVAAEYDGTGKLVGAARTSKLDLDSGANERLTVQLSGVTGEKDNTIKIFAFADNMKPHTKEFFIKE